MGEHTGPNDPDETASQVAPVVIPDAPPADAPLEQHAGQPVHAQIQQLCGACDTGLELYARGISHDLVVPAALEAAVERCVNVGLPMELSGRDARVTGSCDTGSCRLFMVESIVADCPPLSDDTITFHGGVFSQCLGTTRESVACRTQNDECRYHANVPHPCSNSGVMCDEDRELTSAQATRPCQCVCPTPPRAGGSPSSPIPQREPRP